MRHLILTIVVQSWIPKWALLLATNPPECDFGAGTRVQDQVATRHLFLMIYEIGGTP